MRLQPESSECVDLAELARAVLVAAQKRNLSIATAESCTGGFLASLLAGAEGLSHQFAAGFIVYSDDSKTTLLGIPGADVTRFGAVSREIVSAMSRSALEQTGAGIAIAVSGYTGPKGGDRNGVVHFSISEREGASHHAWRCFGDVSRDEGRVMAAVHSLRMLQNVLTGRPARPGNGLR